jgi:hypothetical protein
VLWQVRRGTSIQLATVAVDGVPDTPGCEASSRVLRWTYSSERANVRLTSAQSPLEPPRVGSFSESAGLLTHDVTAAEAAAVCARNIRLEIIID